MHRVLACIAALCLADCAPIEHHVELDRPVGASGIAGIGDLVIRANKTRDMENIFGRASMYGRQTNEGYSELHFAGVDEKGQVILYRKDLAIVTNETTMSRSPFTSSFWQSNGSGSATVAGNTVYGSGQASGSSLTIHPVPEYHQVIPAGAMQVTVPAGVTSIPFEGHTLTILKATPVELDYRIDG